MKAACPARAVRRAARRLSPPRSRPTPALPPPRRLAGSRFAAAASFKRCFARNRNVFAQPFWHAFLLPASAEVRYKVLLLPPRVPSLPLGREQRHVAANASPEFVMYVQENRKF